MADDDLEKKMTIFEWLVAILTFVEAIFMIVVAYKWWQNRQFDTEHMEMDHDFAYNPQDDMTPREAVVLGRAFSLYGEYISKEHLEKMSSWAGAKYKTNIKRHYKKT